MKCLGIDMGSREVKIVVSNRDAILEKRIFSTVHFYRNYCGYDKRVVVDMMKLGYSFDDFSQCISTGYGRNNIDLKDFTPISEIKAHVYGAAHQSMLRDFVLLDLGGQDVKVVDVTGGLICDLDLNDKCAASCGRYLENMAALLEITVDAMGQHYDDPIQLNSTCAVFSESELIGNIAEGVPLERLCAGVNHSMVNRILPMILPHAGKKILVSGGAAHNNGVVKLLQQKLGNVSVIDDPQYNGAIGCCVYGQKSPPHQKGLDHVQTHR